MTAFEWTLGQRILEKAKFEYLKRKDYSTSIIFSALAIEAELARLFIKWRGIDGLRIDRQEPKVEQFEEEFRRLGRAIDERIEGVARLLDESGIDEFARTTDYAQVIESDFPSLNLGSLATDTQRAVFWPRNRILHAGFAEYGEAGAKRAFNVATLVLGLFAEMDAARRARNDP